MAKIALINIGLHGHVNPTIGFTEELIRRGHEMVYLGDPELKDKITRTGARFVEYGSLFSQNLFGNRHDPKERARRFIEEAESTLPRIIAILERENPDVVIYDFISVAARLALDHLGIPAVKFFTTYAATDTVNPLAKAFNFQSDPDLEEEYSSRFHALCTRYGYNRCSIREVMARPEASNLVFIPRSFHPDSEKFDDRFHFVGPCLRRADGLLASDLSLQGKAPLLLISLGTLFHDWPEFYRDCIKAFDGKPWRVAMSVGPRTDIPALGPIPDNVFIRPHLPQLDLLALADLFVSHGGMNSTMEALYFGVPLVVIPQMEEQSFSANRIDELNLGRHLDRAQVTPEKLIEAVEFVSKSQEIRDNAARMRADVRAAGGTMKAVAVIEGRMESARRAKKGGARRAEESRI